LKRERVCNHHGCKPFFCCRPRTVLPPSVYPPRSRPRSTSARRASPDGAIARNACRRNRPRLPSLFAAALDGNEEAV